MVTTLYSADVVCSMTRPPIAGGGVLVVDDTIVAVDEAEALRAAADRRHHVAGALLPGLVNGHTHLELADAGMLAREGPLDAWTTAVDSTVASWSDETWQRSAHRGVQQVLRAGATTVCDTVTRGPAVPAASRAGLLGDSFVEICDVDVTHVDGVVAGLEHALGLPADGRRVGVGAASPVRLGSGVVQALAAVARRRGAPLQVHAGMGQAEAAALRDGVGPLADRARTAQLAFEWLDGSGAASAVAYLDALGVLHATTSIVHGAGVTVQDAGSLTRHRVAVVCCPRANQRLRMGDVVLEHMAAAETPMALGTESLAAATDQDVLAEARAWAQAAARRGLSNWPTPNGPVPLAEAALRLATVDGARALGWGDAAGVLKPGRRADLVGVEVATEPARAYEDLVAHGPGRQVLTVLAGVRKARRPTADEPWPAVVDDSWRASA